jgi:hypothetical protein
MESLEKIDEFFEGLSLLFKLLKDHVIPIIAALLWVWAVFNTIRAYVEDWGWKGIFVGLLHWGAGIALVYAGIELNFILIAIPGIVLIISAIDLGSD